MGMRVRLAQPAVVDVDGVGRQLVVDGVVPVGPTLAILGGGDGYPEDGANQASGPSAMHEPGGDPSPVQS